MRIAARHDAIAETVARLALTVHAFETELNTLDTAATRLKSAWNGEAQHAYDRAHHEWVKSIREMKALLTEATRRLRTVNAISIETATTATRIWT